MRLRRDRRKQAVSIGDLEDVLEPAWIRPQNREAVVAGSRELPVRPKRDRRHATRTSVPTNTTLVASTTCDSCVRRYLAAACPPDAGRPSQSAPESATVCSGA